MDNVEFVKAYEHWKLFEAVDVSPERFQKELDFKQQATRIAYLLDQLEQGLNVHPSSVFAGEHDFLIEEEDDYKEAEND